MKKIRGKSRITEEDVKAISRELKLALLEADVNFKVVKDFIGKILVTNPKKRFKTSQIKAHPWFNLKDSTVAPSSERDFLGSLTLCSSLIRSK